MMILHPYDWYAIGVYLALTTCYSSFGIVLKVVTLELDKLVEAKLAQCRALPRVLPSGPGEILLSPSQLEQSGAGVSTAE